MSLGGLIHGLLAVGQLPAPVQAKVDTIVQWAGGLVSAMGVIGILGVAGKMVLDHGRTGGGAGHMAGLGYVLAGCILAATAGALVALLV
jgi:hypothetical protein